MSLETPSQYERGVDQGMRWGARDERDRVVSFLRRQGGEFAHQFADKIEVGEHWK